MNADKLRTYSCAKGHTWEVRGAFTPLEVTNNDGTNSYMFCFKCWGEFAESQWPLKCDDVAN